MYTAIIAVNKEDKAYMLAELQELNVVYQEVIGSFQGTIEDAFMVRGSMFTMMELEKLAMEYDQMFMTVIKHGSSDAWIISTGYNELNMLDKLPYGTWLATDKVGKDEDYTYIPATDTYCVIRF